MSINMILAMRRESAWVPSVLKAVASEGIGTAEIAGRIGEHRQYLEASGKFAERRRKRLEDRVRALVADRLRVDFWVPERERLLHEKSSGLLRFETTPYDIADELINHFRNA
jgi:LAO/AO transport system kinase